MRIKKIITGMLMASALTLCLFNSYSDRAMADQNGDAAATDGNPTRSYPNLYAYRGFLTRTIESVNRDVLPIWNSKADMDRVLSGASEKLKNNDDAFNLGLSYTDGKGGVNTNDYEALKWQVAIYRFEPDASFPETRFVAQAVWAKDAAGKSGYFYFGISLPNTAQNYKGQARISFFGKGAVANARNCEQGADLGDGITCPVSYPMVLGHTYELVAAIRQAPAMPGGWAVVGTIRDETTNTITILGSFGMEGQVRSMTAPLLFVEGTSKTDCSLISNFGMRLWPTTVYKRDIKTTLYPQIDAAFCQKTLYKQMPDGSTVYAYGPWVTP